jgi:outer membrane receptor protein involved in Fe transport
MRWLITLTFYCLIVPTVFAQFEIHDPEEQTQMLTDGDEEGVTYPAMFFQRYQPVNAYDMVQRVPGFTLDNGGDRRGFGAAAGNILINGRRPSTKDDLPSALLSRIPASNVERIELIRGQLRGIDMRGQSVVANVIMREDTPATTRWNVIVGENLEQGLTPQIDVTLTDSSHEVQYSVGGIIYVTSNGDPGPEKIFEGDGNLIEKRYNFKGHGHNGFEGYDATGFANALTWFGETLVQFNSKVASQHRNMKTLLTRVPQPPGSGDSRSDLFYQERRNHIIEVGLDAERFLSDNLLAKAIVLYNYTNQYPDDTQRTLDHDGIETRFVISDTKADISEAIARLELNWAGWENHAVQFNLEGALNILDKTLIRITDEPNVASVVEQVPGGNVRVKEERGDFLTKDTWTLGNITLDYGLGVEISTLTTTGDTEQSRKFTFLKPESLLTYAPNRRMQTRIGIRRDIAQLRLEDFASTTLLEDNELTVGNPNLIPQATWVFDLSQEWRFGEIGVVTLSAYYHSITDVIDLLPIEVAGRPDEFFEAVGNIGDGSRTGLRLESTLSLDWTGLQDARMDMQLGWQDSSVTDPVTGEDRVLRSSGYFNPHPAISFENETEWTFIIDYRQDFEASRFSWGWRAEDQGERPQFKTNEYDLRDASLRLHAFVETTRWWDLNIRLAFENLLNFDKSRDRLVFTGLRDQSPMAFREVEHRTIGTDMILTVSGRF